MMKPQQRSKIVIALKNKTLSIELPSRVSVVWLFGSPLLLHVGYSDTRDPQISKIFHGRKRRNKTGVEITEAEQIQTFKNSRQRENIVTNKEKKIELELVFGKGVVQMHYLV